jgi:serpin B
MEVDEEGAEAAAATGVVMASLSSGSNSHLEFRADHPFIFVLRGNHNGTILFMGRLTNPGGN